jgi:hypothetical protein
MPSALRSLCVLALAALPALGCTSLLGDFAAAEGALTSTPTGDASSDATPGAPAAPATPDSLDGATAEPERDADRGGPGDAAAPPPGQPVRLATGETGVHALALDATNVYVTRFASAGDVKQLPLAGGAAIVLGSGIDGPTDVALDGAGSVSWVTVGGNATWQLFDAKIGVAGSAQPLLSPPTPGAAHGIAVDASRVFVGQVSTAGYATILSIPRVGGPAVALAGGPGMVGNVRERGGDVVWTDTETGRVYSVSKTAANSLVAVASRLLQPSELVLFGDTVFWINHATAGAASIWSGTIGVTSSGKPIASNLGQPAGIATDGALVFWTDATTGELLSMNLDGTDKKRVVGAIAQPGPLAVTATHLVWYDAADGSIWKLSR